MHEIKFISYDGKWPCLCSGTLIIEVDGKEYKLENILSSGGSTNWHTGRIKHGDWKIDSDELPEELRPLTKEICEVVNENVTPGCCGGCI